MMSCSSGYAWLRKASALIAIDVVRKAQMWHLFEVACTTFLAFPSMRRWSVQLLQRSGWRRDGGWVTPTKWWISHSSKSLPKARPPCHRACHREDQMRKCSFQSISNMNHASSLCPPALPLDRTDIPITHRQHYARKMKTHPWTSITITTIHIITIMKHILMQPLLFHGQSTYYQFIPDSADENEKNTHLLGHIIDECNSRPRGRHGDNRSRWESTTNRVFKCLLLDG